MPEEFTARLRGLDKSENTIRTYRHDVMRYLRWHRDSFGTEPEVLYRANTLDCISYTRNIRGCRPRTVNSHLSSLKSLNEYLMVSGVQAETAVQNSDFMKIQIQYASPCTVEKKDVETFRQCLPEGGERLFHPRGGQPGGVGYSSVQTTLIYSNLTAKEMKGKANRL